MDVGGRRHLIALNCLYTSRNSAQKISKRKYSFRTLKIVLVVTNSKSRIYNKKSRLQDPRLLGWYYAPPTYSRIIIITIKQNTKHYGEIVFWNTRNNTITLKYDFFFWFYSITINKSKQNLNIKFVRRYYCYVTFYNIRWTSSEDNIKMVLT